MKKLLSTYILFFAVVVSAMGQNAPLLTLNEAIEIALKNNYDILLVKNDADIADINNTIGNAGMLPEVTLNVSQNAANSTINQKFTSGLEVQRAGVGSANFNANVAMNWVLFDGMRMFVAKNRLEELEAQGQLNLKEQLQQTVAQVMREYYALVSTKMQIKATAKALELANNRKEITLAKYNVGVVSGFELNQVSIDQNNFSANLLLQQTQLRNNMMGFNSLLGREPAVEFDVPDSIVRENSVQFNDENPSAVLEKQNFSLLSAEKAIRISEFSARETSAGRLPVLIGSAAYNYTRQTSQAGFSLLNQSNGLNFGFAASMPLFTGFNLRNREKVARIQVRSSVFVYDRLKNELSYTYRSAINNYNTYLSIDSLEDNSVKLAYDNITIADARFAQGLSGMLEVKEAERNWQDAETRLINARYNLKLAEIDLRMLRGELVK